MIFAMSGNSFGRFDTHLTHLRRFITFLLIFPLVYGTGQMTITENTRSIHHYVASWHSNIEKKIIKIQQRYALRGKVGCKMEKLETLPLRIKNKIDKLGLSGMIKFAVKRLWGKSL